MFFLLEYLGRIYLLDFVDVLRFEENRHTVVFSCQASSQSVVALVASSNRLHCISISLHAAQNGTLATSLARSSGFGGLISVLSIVPSGVE